jgi:hypothetical protein
MDNGLRNEIYDGGLREIVEVAKCKASILSLFQTPPLASPSESECSINQY